LQGLRAFGAVSLQNQTMEPRPSPDCQAQGELRMHKTRLANLLNERHPMVRLAREIDWHGFDEYFGTYYSGGKGRPATSTRLMVSLHYLKYTHDLSDEAVVMGWVENPYWQYLSGMEFFCHEPPIDPSSMSRWRRRVGEAGSEELLKQTIECGLKLKIIKPSELRRVNVDTTVQEKHIRHPTDGRLYNRMRQRLVAAALREGLKLRQSYVRVGKRLLAQQSRYAHARQWRRARGCTRKLRTILGRVIRDIERKALAPGEDLRGLLALARRLYRQKRHDKGKLYSVHAPEVECISKGKAHKRYEFGSKVALAVSSKGGWVLAAQALEGNPYDGHTLQSTMDRIVARSGTEPEHVYCDMGYRGHDYEGECEVHVGQRRRGSIAKSLWRWMKRRAAIEPSIGHLKEERRMERCRLKGAEGDKVNAVLSAAAMNFSKLLAALGALLSFLLTRLVARFALRSPRRIPAAAAG
jgi:transposase, IS5 family